MVDPVVVQEVVEVVGGPDVLPPVDPVVVQEVVEVVGGPETVLEVVQDPVAVV